MIRDNITDTSKAEIILVTERSCVKFNKFGVCIDSKQWDFLDDDGWVVVRYGIRTIHIHKLVKIAAGISSVGK